MLLLNFISIFGLSVWLVALVISEACLSWNVQVGEYIRGSIIENPIQLIHPCRPYQSPGNLTAEERRHASKRIRSCCFTSGRML